MLFDDLTALEDEQRRQTPNTVGHRAFRRYVHVTLDDKGLALKLRGKSLKVGRKGLARPTPRSPEIDKDRKLTLQDHGFEINVGYVEHCSHQAEILKATWGQIQHDVGVTSAYLPLQYGNVIR